MQYRNCLQRLSQTIGKADDIILGVPVVEMTGDHRVLIENHKGVIEYGKERICVNVKFGCLCINGSVMEITRMTKDQLVISGEIDSVSVQRKGRI